MGKKSVILDATAVATILAGGKEVEVDLGEATPANAAGTTPATPAAPAASAAPAAAPAADAGVVSLLTSQLATKDADLLAANVKLAKLEAAAKDGADNLPGLLAIAQSVIGNMQVALGASPTSAALDAKAAVAEHARLLPIYTEKFKTGGIAAASGEKTDDNSVQPHPAFMERLHSVRSANAK
jgi:hypothetical protein